MQKGRRTSTVRYNRGVRRAIHLPWPRPLTTSPTVVYPLFTLLWPIYAVLWPSGYGVTFRLCPIRDGKPREFESRQCQLFLFPLYRDPFGNLLSSPPPFDSKSSLNFLLTSCRPRRIETSTPRSDNGSIRLNSIGVDLDRIVGKVFIPLHG